MIWTFFLQDTQCCVGIYFQLLRVFPIIFVQLSVWFLSHHLDTKIAPFQVKDNIGMVLSLLRSVLRLIFDSNNGSRSSLDKDNIFTVKCLFAWLIVGFTSGGPWGMKLTYKSVQSSKLDKLQAAERESLGLMIDWEWSLNSNRTISNSSESSALTAGREANQAFRWNLLNLHLFSSISILY